MRSPMSTYEIQVQEHSWSVEQSYATRTTWPSGCAKSERDGTKKEKSNINKRLRQRPKCAAIRASMRANEQAERKRKKKVSIFFLFHNEPLISNAENKCDDITALRCWWWAPHGWPFILVMHSHFELCQQRAVAMPNRCGGGRRAKDNVEDKPRWTVPDQIKSNRQHEKWFPFRKERSGQVRYYNRLQTKSREKIWRWLLWDNSCRLLLFVSCFSSTLLLFAIRRWSVYKLISFRSGTDRRVLIRVVPYPPFNILCDAFPSIRSQFCIQSRSEPA